MSAKRILYDEFPNQKITITELKDLVHIEEYTPMLSAPSLVVNEKLVCMVRVPSREEILAWLRNALDE